MRLNILSEISYISLEKSLFLTLCSGKRTRRRKVLCSFFKGTVKPLIILPNTSNNSAIPLCRSVSYLKILRIVE